MDIRIHKIRDKLELANLKNPKSRTFEDSYPKIASWHRSKVGNNGWLLGLLGSPRIAIIPFKGLGFLKVIEVPQIFYFIFGCSMIFNHVQWFLKHPAIGVPPWLGTPPFGQLELAITPFELESSTTRPQPQTETPDPRCPGQSLQCRPQVSQYWLPAGWGPSSLAKLVIKFYLTTIVHDTCNILQLYLEWGPINSQTNL